MDDRYLRQTAFSHIGSSGQERLKSARVAVLGLGALGSASAITLARSGVGFLRVVDRDCVELSNLTRQILYDEHDAKTAAPKAIAAERHLSAMNSDITIEPVVADINAATIIDLIGDVDLVIDGLDNFDTRVLLNEACAEHNIPWIYGSAIGSRGMTLNILPGGPCFRCLLKGDPPKDFPTVSTEGIIAPAAAVTSALQCAEALKILTGFEPRKEAVFFDLYKNAFEILPVIKNKKCKVCVQHKYCAYGHNGVKIEKILNSESMQVVPAHHIDIPAALERMAKHGTLVYTEHFTELKADICIRLFTDGRAIITPAKDENYARAVYEKYIAPLE